jgi:hypothetical protein
VTTNSIIGLALRPGCHAPFGISLKITFVRFVGYSDKTVLEPYRGTFFSTSMTFRRGRDSLSCPQGTAAISPTI